MECDMKENVAKIIAAKTKQIQIQAEKYEGLIKEEVKKIIEIQNKIKVVENEQLIEEEKENKILNYEIEIKLIRKNIRELTKQKADAIGTDMNIGFNDDLFIKQDYII